MYCSITLTAYLKNIFHSLYLNAYRNIYCNNYMYFGMILNYMISSPARTISG